MVSHERHGLPCRADPSCPFVAQVPDDLALTLRGAAERRDSHEFSAHVYTHVRYEPTRPPFANTRRRGNDAA